jgi:hypothetical protein
MTAYNFLLDAPRPYFAEIPYALWGQVNYDSEGDCKRPTDQEWMSLELTHRDSRQRVVVTSSGNEFRAESDEAEIAARAACYLLERSAGTIVGHDPRQHIGNWSYAEAYAGTARIRAEFPRPELKPFDSHLFWGSWKWVGWFATDFTWVGRWIMNSVLTRDTRAVCLCIDWLKAPPVHPDQSAALRSALQTLTDRNYDTDQEWISWYEGGLFRTPGRKLYPEPDFEAWLAELKRMSE